MLRRGKGKGGDEGKEKQRVMDKQDVKDSLNGTNKVNGKREEMVRRMERRGKEFNTVENQDES